MDVIYVNWKIIMLIIIFWDYLLDEIIMIIIISWDYLLDEEFWILIKLGFLIYIYRESFFSVFLYMPITGFIFLFFTASSFYILLPS